MVVNGDDCIILVLLYTPAMWALNTRVHSIYSGHDMCSIAAAYRQLRTAWGGMRAKVGREHILEWEIQHQQPA
jgi:hypothetical protein